MKCPICGKELEMRNRQVGTDENGEPVFNEYAICRDCKKQWNLDKQRAKRAAAKKAAQEASAPKAAPVKKSAAPEAAPVKKEEKETPANHEAPIKADVKRTEKPAPKRRPRPESEISEEPHKKPVKRRKTSEAVPEEEKRYSNLPPEKVRNKRGKAARKSYEDMLETGMIDKKAVNRKRKKQLDDETSEIRRSTQNKRAEEPDEYDDEEYYDDNPRFRPMRIILGILSLAAFGYLIYRGFVTGLTDTTEGGTVSSGMTYVILALCMLVSALLYFIMQTKNTIFAFLLPMVFYLGSAVFAFIQKGDDLQLLIAAVAGAVLAVISLILAVTSRGGYEDEYDDDYDEDDEDE